MLKATRSWIAKIGLGITALVVVTTVALLNPVRESDSPKKAQPVKVYDQDISIPSIPVTKSMRPRKDAADRGAQLGVLSRWTEINNGDDPGHLRIDLTSIHLWRKIERAAWFQYIPKEHTMDENRNRLILYELVNDTFECAQGMAEKLTLIVYYEDGTEQTYDPWRSPGAQDWMPVRPGTTLSREMHAACSVELATESSALDIDRVLGTWQVSNGVQGSIAAGPLVISETQVTWTAPGGQECTSEYQLASRSVGSTFPGGPPVDDGPDVAYTTFVVDQEGPHQLPCSKNMNSLTMSFVSTQRDMAYFTAFFLAPQAFGTMRRALAKQ